MKEVIDSNNELNVKYNVFGSFYSFTMHKRKYNCRNVCDIINTQNLSINENNLIDIKPDSIFIMLNPGKSAPKSNLYKEKDFVLLSQINFEEVSIDPTQRQIIILMEKVKWNHVRIINLSDICAPKSEDFWKSFDELIHTNHIHSIFHDQRTSEFEMLCSTDNIYAAWTVEPPTELIQLCKKRIDINKIKGVKKDNNDYSYYHPLPWNKEKKDGWINKMQELIIG